MSSLSLSARTILGPLTTTFTPAPSCTIPVIACSTCNYGWGAQTCFSGGVEDFTGCWPATGTSANLPSPTQPLWGWGFYSPGLVCPQGYASACSATATNIATGTWTPQWSMSAGETAVGCCPSNYACTSNNPGVNTCAFIATSTRVSVSTCISGTAAPVSTVSVPFLAGGTKEDTFTVYAPLIEIVWQSTDLVSTTSTATKTKTSVSGAGKASTTGATKSSQVSSSTSSGSAGITPMPSATQNSQSSSSTSASPSSSSSPSSGVSNRMGAGVRVYLAIGWMAALTVLLV